MARTAVSIETVDRDGIAPSESVAIPADGVEIVNDGKMFVILKNEHTGAVVMTFQIAQTVDGESVTNKTVSVTNGTYKVVGPFPTNIYNQTGGKLYIDAATADVVKVSPLVLTEDT